MIKDDEIIKTQEPVDAITSQIRPILQKFERDITEKVLSRVFSTLYYQNYNRACNYNNMTGEQIVLAQHEVLSKLEKEFNYSFENDLLDCPFCED